MADICLTVTPDLQSRFISGRGATEFIFSITKIQDKCDEQIPCYILVYMFFAVLHFFLDVILWKTIGILVLRDLMYCRYLICMWS